MKTKLNETERKLAQKAVDDGLNSSTAEAEEMIQGAVDRGVTDKQLKERESEAAAELAQG